MGQVEYERRHHRLRYLVCLFRPEALCYPPEPSVDFGPSHPNGAQVEIEAFQNTQPSELNQRLQSFNME